MNNDDHDKCQPFPKADSYRIPHSNPNPIDSSRPITIESINPNRRSHLPQSQMNMNMNTDDNQYDLLNDPLTIEAIMERNSFHIAEVAQILRITEDNLLSCLRDFKWMKNVRYRSATKFSTDNCFMFDRAGDTMFTRLGLFQILKVIEWLRSKCGG